MENRGWKAAEWTAYDAGANGTELRIGPLKVVVWKAERGSLKWGLTCNWSAEPRSEEKGFKLIERVGFRDMGSARRIAEGMIRSHLIDLLDFKVGGCKCEQANHCRVHPRED